MRMTDWDTQAWTTECRQVSFLLVGLCLGLSTMLRLIWMVYHLSCFYTRVMLSILRPDSSVSV